MMADELNTSCLKFLKILDDVASGGASEKEGTKIQFTRPAIIETKELRTYYYLEKRLALDQNKNWKSTGQTGKYIIVAPRKDDKGMTRVRAVQSSELW